MKVVNHLVCVWSGCGSHSMSLEPQPLHHGIICVHTSDSTDFSWLPKSGPASVVVAAWWWIHIPSHSIWRLSRTLHMFEVDVGAISCGFRASTTAPYHHLCSQWTHDLWFQLSSKILASKSGGNCMMTDPYPQEQNTKVVYDLVYVLVNVGAIPCGCNASTTAPWHHLWHTRNTDLSWLLKSGPASVVVMAWCQIHIPIHSIWRLSMTSCVWSECGSHSMWV